jgi:hypothetical protein
VQAHQPGTRARGDRQDDYADAKGAFGRGTYEPSGFHGLMLPHSECAVASTIRQCRLPFGEWLHWGD